MGTGVETTIDGLHAQVATAAGVSRPARPAAPLDPARAAMQLGWRPRTGLAEGTAGSSVIFRLLAPFGSFACYVDAMPPVPSEVTERVIDDRRRLGIDRRDERWAGVWHLVNPPKSWHTELNNHLAWTLGPRALERRLRAVGEAGVFGAPDDWRVPDQVYARPEDVREEGVVTAELVVEIRSPGDDSYKKLPFFASRGVAEVLIVHEDRQVQLFRLDGRGEMAMVVPGPEGVCSEALGVTFTTTPGPKLRTTWDGGAADV